MSSREGSLFITEEFAFEEVFGEGSHVDSDKRLQGAPGPQGPVGPRGPGGGYGDKEDLVRRSARVSAAAGVAASAVVTCDHDADRLVVGGCGAEPMWRTGQTMKEYVASKG